MDLRSANVHLRLIEHLYHLQPQDIVEVQKYMSLQCSETFCYMRECELVRYARCLKEQGVHGLVSSSLMS
jgi:hypothetical protein